MFGPSSRNCRRQYPGSRKHRRAIPALRCAEPVPGLAVGKTRGAGMTMQTPSPRAAPVARHDEAGGGWGHCKRVGRGLAAGARELAHRGGFTLLTDPAVLGVMFCRNLRSMPSFFSASFELWQSLDLLYLYMRNFRRTVAVGLFLVGLAGIIQSIHDPLGSYWRTLVFSISITIVGFSWILIEWFFFKKDDIEKSSIWNIGEARSVYFDNHIYRGNRSYLSADKVENIKASNIDLDSESGRDDERS